MHTPQQNPWPIFIVLLVSVFIMIEAAAFQAPVLPSLIQYFEVSVNLIALSPVLYYLALAVFAPIMGWLGDQWGGKRILNFGVIVFAVGQILAAQTDSYLVFLAARFIQGLGVACVLPCVFAYLGHLFSEDKRGIALGILIFAMTFGAASGGLLGGILIDRFDWTSIYWLSGVLAILGLPFMMWIVPDIRAAKERAVFDFLGAVLLFVTIAALLSIPTWINTFGPRSAITWAIALTGLTALIVLLRHGKRHPSPIIDTGLLSNPGFGLPCLIYWLMGLFSTSAIYALAFFVTTRPGGNATQFGLVMLAIFGTSMLFAPLAGRLIDKIEPRLVITLSVAGLLLGAVGYLQLHIQISLWSIVALAALIGVMIGCMSPAIMKLALGEIVPARMGTGTGLMSMLRDLGYPTGSSLSLALFDWSMTRNSRLALHTHTESLNISESARTALADATGSGPDKIPAAVTDELQQAGTDPTALLELIRLDSLEAAVNNIGYLLFVIMAISLLLSFRLRRSRKYALETVPGGTG